MVNLKQIAFFSAVLGSTSAFAVPINQISYNLLKGMEVVTFDEVAAKVDLNDLSSFGTAHDTLVFSQGVAFGEHFNGQLISPSGNFDIPTGQPTEPLELLPGPPRQNLYATPVAIIDLATLQFNNVLAGVGQRGAASAAGGGEGAISILFSSDQSEFGLQLLGLNGGNTYFDFFRNDGSLIQSITARAVNDSYLGFIRENSIQDIRGITIWNNDPNGIAIDNIRHDMISNLSAVPETNTSSMALTGLLAISLVLRKRRDMNKLTKRSHRARA